ncbi:hypothetical protein E2C01_027487 [Portunus trituberculatus]|uniref:Uncharacterized protein n=1 Tax=Portunus trituberculatus TaxID=210409 RepID=A0A5B7ELA8_PORTR|nr:hypothetical protein [Portunus trituberculatus]
MNLSDDKKRNIAQEKREAARGLYDAAPVYSKLLNSIYQPHPGRQRSMKSQMQVNGFSWSLGVTLGSLTSSASSTTSIKSRNAVNV